MINNVTQQNVIVWATSAIKIACSGTAGGPFQLGETITESVSSATGVLKDADSLSAPTYVILEPASGSLTGGHTLTGGTSSATATGGTKTTSPVQSLSTAGCNGADLQHQDASDAAWFTVDGSTPQAAAAKGSQKLTANSDAITSVRLFGYPIRFLSASAKYPSIMVRLYE
jgi:hypothetical protein